MTANISYRLLLMCRLLNIDRGALAASSGCTALTVVALTTAACPHLLLCIHLAEVFKVDFHDFMHQTLHLGLVLHHFCNIDDFLPLQEVQEVSQIFHYLLLVLALRLR